MIKPTAFILLLAHLIWQGQKSRRLPQSLSMIVFISPSAV
jgi:hypothetical protein